MKKLSIILAFVCAYNTVVAQSVHTYRFVNNLQEQNGVGPALQPICTGTFTSANLPDFNFSQAVYHFDQNCGFSYNDANGFIASGSYTIELYFALTGLTSWKRVIDFKDRTTDNGCYVYNGQMNFYNIATSNGTPFAANEYSHYVITRNATDKLVTMYGDGHHYIQFTDSNDDAIYDSGNKKLNFFQDDLAVGNEASDGYIAMLKIYNYALDSNAVKTAFDGLSGSLGVADAYKNKIVLNVGPNPAYDALTISVDKAAMYNYTITDMTGKLLQQGMINTTSEKINVSEFANGIYLIKLTDKDGNVGVQKFIKQ